MSRILKRPMFKRGGQSNDGIMSNVVDREQYALGSIDEEKLRSDAAAITGVLDRFAPIQKTRLPLGEVGFLLASGADPIDALGAGYSKFVKADDATRAARAKRDQAAVSTALSSQLKAKEPKTTEAYKNAIAQGLIPGTPKFNEYIRSATLKEDASTAAIRNANELEKLGFFKNPEDKAKYIQAATIRGAGLNIEFNPDGTIKAITEGDKPKGPNQSKIFEIQNTAFQLNNAGGALINELKGAKVGAVGTIIEALDSTGAQISQAAQTFGIGSKENLDLSKGTTQIDNYLEEKFGSALANDAVKFAKIKSVSINLAYLMAKADEPGGRYTDKDIALKMREMGLGSNPERTIEVLTNSINLRNKNLNYGYGLLTDGKTLDFSKMDAVGSFALGLQESAKDQKSGGKKVEETLPTFSFDSKGNPLILKDGEFVPYKGN